jgi:hypothetical protein
VLTYPDRARLASVPRAECGKGLLIPNETPDLQLGVWDPSPTDCGILGKSLHLSGLSVCSDVMLADKSGEISSATIFSLALFEYSGFPSSNEPTGAEELAKYEVVFPTSS